MTVFMTAELLRRVKDRGKRFSTRYGKEIISRSRKYSMTDECRIQEKDFWMTSVFRPGVALAIHLPSALECVCYLMDLTII